MFRAFNLLISLLVFGQAIAIANEIPVVPMEMDYCGIRLKYTPEGRQKIQNYVNKIWDNPTLVGEMVERADMYLPFIADALNQLGVPEDLKYIAIQESGLKGAAVSSSNAVGFWQFKDFTAIEVGLSVDEAVDERKHIFRASIGAGKYFAKNYRRYDNWLYAVISYYEGGTGALPYLSRTYYGAKAMLIDENLHWYAQKAIAHKIAYESKIGLKAPSVWLEPKSNSGEIVVAQLMADNDVPSTEFKKYNLWIKQAHLPADKLFSYYVPKVSGPYVHVPDPHKSIYPPEQFIPIEQRDPLAEQNTKPAQSETKNETKLAEPEDPPFPPYHVYQSRYSRTEHRWVPSEEKVDVKEYFIQKDPYYGQEFVLATDKYNLVDMSIDFGVSLSKLRKYNGLTDGNVAKVGDLVCVVNPKKAHIHIAKKNETPMDIAIKYKKNVDHLQIFNDFSSITQKLYAGQKVYLKDYKPVKESIIIYHVDPNFKPIYGEKPVTPAPKPVEQPKPAPKEEPATPQTPADNTPKPAPKTEYEFPTKLEPAVPKRTKMGSHTVQPKETLFGVARQYGMTAKELRELNQLQSDGLIIGQVLKVWVE